MQTAWIVYIASVAGLLLAFAWLLRRWFSVATLAAIGLCLLALLLTPAGVPDTQVLAPAALSAVYELLFGDPATASQLARPLGWTTGLLLLVMLAWLFLKRGMYKK